MTDKQFVLKHNPKLEFSTATITVTEFGILIKNDSGELIMPPIPLKHEKQMWKTLRNKMNYQMLKKLEK